MSHTNQLLFCGKLTKIHGLHGGVLSTIISEHWEIIYKSVVDINNNPINILDYRLHNKKKNQYILKIQSINTLELAHNLIGKEIFIAKEVLHQLIPKNEESFFFYEIINLPVLDNHNNVIGEVTNVQNFGAGDMLDLKLNTIGERTISFDNYFVEEVNLEQKYLKLTQKGTHYLFYK